MPVTRSNRDPKYLSALDIDPRPASGRKRKNVSASLNQQHHDHDGEEASPSKTDLAPNIPASTDATSTNPRAVHFAQPYANTGIQRRYSVPGEFLNPGHDDDGARGTSSSPGAASRAPALDDNVGSSNAEDYKAKDTKRAAPNPSKAKSSAVTVLVLVIIIGLVAAALFTPWASASASEETSPTPLPTQPPVQEVECAWYSKNDSGGQADGQGGEVAGGANWDLKEEDKEY